MTFLVLKYYACSRKHGITNDLAINFVHAKKNTISEHSY